MVIERTKLKMSRPGRVESEEEKMSEPVQPETKHFAKKNWASCTWAITALFQIETINVNSMTKVKAEKSEIVDDVAFPPHLRCSKEKLWTWCCGWRVWIVFGDLRLCMGLLWKSCDAKKVGKNINPHWQSPISLLKQILLDLVRVLYYPFKGLLSLHMWHKIFRFGGTKSAPKSGNCWVTN